MSKKTADLICRGLLMIVAAIRAEAGLPPYHDITIQVVDDKSVTVGGTIGYTQESETVIKSGS